MMTFLSQAIVHFGESPERNSITSSDGSASLAGVSSINSIKRVLVM